MRFFLASMRDVEYAFASSTSSSLFSDFMNGTLDSELHCIGGLFWEKVSRSVYVRGFESSAKQGPKAHQLRTRQDLLLLQMRYTQTLEKHTRIETPGSNQDESGSR